MKFKSGDKVRLIKDPDPGGPFEPPWGKIAIVHSYLGDGIYSLDFDDCAYNVGTQDIEKVE